MPDYTLGLDSAFVVCRSAIYLFATVSLALCAYASRSERGILGFFISWIGTALLAAVPFIVFCVLVIVPLFVLVFPLMNLASHRDNLAILLKAELASGVIGLRIVSILLPTKALRDLFRGLFREWPKPWSPRIMRRSERQILPVIPGYVLYTWSFFQTATFLLIISALWLFLSRHVSGIEVGILGWLLFFIVDDWIIISDYHAALGGRILRGHSLRLIVCDILLAALLLRLLFIQLPTGQAIGAAIVLLGFLVPSIFLLTSAAVREI
jgi:hypothetical protein